MNQTVTRQGEVLEAEPRTDLAHRDERTVALAAPASMFEVIARAAADPRVDPDKLERLMALHERMQAQKAKVDYGKALAKMQPTLPVIDRRGRITITDKADASLPVEQRRIIQSTSFARWEDIHDAITPILSANGFALSFKPDVAQDGKIVITGVLRHKAGHQEEAAITLPHDSSGSKNPVQAVGSSLSYGKRYAATMLLNILTRDQDDDGVEGGREYDPAEDPNNWITVAEVGNLNTLMEEAGVNRDRFLDYLQIDTLAHLPKQRYQEALKLIADKKRAAAQGGR